MTIAQTILSQIKTIDPRALWAWGAKDFVNTGDGLRFKTSGMTPWKGYVEIKLDEGKDLYKIKFFRIRKFEVKVDCELEDVYADCLVSFIDEMVG